MPLKLNQMLALRKGHQASAHVVISEIHKTHQKPGLFTGHSKVYQPDDESGEQLFPESSQIQQNVDTLLSEVKK